jgi:hypothetical protein
MISSTPSQDNHTQYTTEIPVQDFSAANTPAFFPNKENLDYNKDSLNKIIESKIAEIQKQRENEFLQGKFVGYQKEAKKALNAFQNDEIFPKEKQENLSDEQLKIYAKKISSAKDLPSLQSACETIVSYIEKLLNKKDVQVE